jgi:hypothetical protein
MLLGRREEGGRMNKFIATIIESWRSEEKDYDNLWSVMT